MPPQKLHIDVDRVEQIEDYYCGAAVAVMILRARGKKGWQSGSDEDLQEAAWEQIMAATTGPKRPEKAADCPSYLEEFDRQQCFLCNQQCHDCWATTPQALRAMLNKNLIKKRQTRIVRDVDEVSATVAILASIDGDMPAAVAAGANSHWIVVRGYLADDPDLESSEVGGRNLNGVYVIDSLPGGDVLDMIPTESWFDEYLQTVKCGSSADHGKHVVIVRKAG